MKYLMGLLASLMLSASVLAAPIHYTGEISGDGNFAGNLDINFGWVDPPFGLNSWGDHLDLWQINGKAGEDLSVAVSSTELSLGFTLYFGAISAEDLLYGLFNNAGDVGSARYLTSSSLWNDTQELNRFELTENGVYTLAIGGRDFGGYSGYGYEVAVSKVPEPSNLALVMLSLFAVAFARRRIQ